MALHAVILAAGKGTRMKSSRPKVLHALAGRTLIEHVLRTVDGLRADSVTVVVGHGADDVRSSLAARSAVQYAVQSPQLGTGHALLQTESVLEGKSGTVLLLYADVPLLQTSTLSKLVEHHRSSKAAATVLTMDLPEPYGYGRIVRDQSSRIQRIVEERDASGPERAITEVNSGIYAFELAPLFESLHHLATDNAQGEYYLTDLVAAYRQRKLKVETVAVDSPSELRGVNSRADLADLSRVLRDRKNASLLMAGVTMEDPASTFVDADVTIGADTLLGPNVILEGSTSIGERCRIHAGCRLTNMQVGDDVIILDHCVLTDSRADSKSKIGPFSHVRPDSAVGEGAHIGNFVELKKTSMGRGSKANHLAYVGDSIVGERVNIGAGVITCNYDGVKKNQTIIEDGSFIGSDSQLIAPVRIGAGSYVGAGSTISKDVPSDALAVSRAPQENKPGWAARRRARNSKGSA